MLRESCFYRRLTDTSKDEENQEESEELQEDMLGGITFFFFHATNLDNCFCANNSESLEILAFLQKLIQVCMEPASLEK